MKKFIFPVILLALLSGCGRIKSTPDTDNDVNIVSGTANGTTTNIMGYETESTTDEMSTSDVTTTKVAGEKVGGTTTEVHVTKKSTTPVQTRASSGNNDGVVHGTTRSVPSVQRTTTTTTSVATTETTTQSSAYDPKDYSNISFELGTKQNEISVLRPFGNGEKKQFQSITDVDTSEIAEELEKDSKKTIDDFIVKDDFDFDGYPDLFIIEKQDEFNKTGKYYRYDQEKGTYTSWAEMNELKNLIDTDQLEKESIVVFYKNEDKIEYEVKTFEWDDEKLVLRKYMHQFENEDGEILVKTIVYDEEGNETASETRDSKGILVSDGGEGDEPTTSNEE